MTVESIDLVLIKSQIIIGGGTAGLAVASRVSVGLPGKSVLVIEAGSDGREDPGIFIPGRKGSTLGGKYDWNFTTVPQPHANNRVISQSRGKVLGGSSALNLMTWDRASEYELNAWEKLGNAGWNWKNLYTAMLKVETFLQSPEYGSEGVGKTGPIRTLINRIIPRHQDSWIPTMSGLGLPNNRESLNGHPIGVMTQPNNIRPNYTRSYSPEYPHSPAHHLKRPTIMRMRGKMTHCDVVDFRTGQKNEASGKAGA